MMSFDKEDNNGAGEGTQQTLLKQPSMGKVQCPKRLRGRCADRDIIDMHQVL